MRNVFRCYEIFLQMMRLADMAKFEFRMQSILNITNQMETQSKMEYAAAQSELRRAEDYMVQLKNERVSYIEEGARLREHSLNVVDMRENTRAIEHTDDKIEGIMKAQSDETAFRRYCSRVIDNSGDTAHTIDQIKALFKR